MNIPSEEELLKKAARKARPGSGIKWRNLPRNWAHQAITYMDAGELSVRILVQLIEMFIVLILLKLMFSDVFWVLEVFFVFLIVHTWNWVTNGLFWALIIFTFPSLHNPGAKNTVNYLNQMKRRLAENKCISGIAIYGSVTRGTWHDRSDIDIRFLRRPGFSSLPCATLITMAERFRAFICKQPMDLFLADDVDFLKKMRIDEIPLFTICRDERLKLLYRECFERDVNLKDLLGDRDHASS